MVQTQRIMSSIGHEEEEHHFFDSLESFASEQCVDFEFESCMCFSEYAMWTRSPKKSVKERRSEFLNWMGLESGGSVTGYVGVEQHDRQQNELDRVLAHSGAVLSSPSFGDEFASSRSSMSSWSTDASDLSDEPRFRDFPGGVEEKFGETEKDDDQEQPHTSEEFQSTFGSSSNLSGTMNRVKKKWLSKLRSAACMADNFGPDHSSPFQGTKFQRVKVRHFKKRWKELSALFVGQEIQAHEGSILAMKFSPDGQYLATAGEDGVVHVWQVVEAARSNTHDIIPDTTDPSCVYFTVNHRSELAPLVDEKEKLGKMRSLKKTAESACIIFPPRIFRILEKPLHQFIGHIGEVLDLSWSENNRLLSSSIDKTVRLWQVGYEHCLKVFSHSDYVTCIQFNPSDNDYFISGSIDGKIRVWAVSDPQVVSWTEIRDLVTAVCYRPDGQEVIVGSMSGSCRFYDVSDNHFQLESQISLHGKKKAVCKRITGFQFVPGESQKLIVTCADWQVRILQGTKVVGKYKGPRVSGNQLSANITVDGKHVVSMCEDSNVYMWNFTNQEKFSVSKKKIVKSWERFSTNASVAIPWSGNMPNSCQVRVSDEALTNKSPLSPPPCHFLLDKEFVLEPFPPKTSATWPEEKLMSSSSSCVVHKSQCKFFQSCQRVSSTSHAWDMVIVTAGWDGKLRSFHNYGLPVAL